MQNSCFKNLNTRVVPPFSPFVIISNQLYGVDYLTVIILGLQMVCWSKDRKKLDINTCSMLNIRYWATIIL